MESRVTAPRGVPKRAWVVRAMSALVLLGIVAASGHHIVQQQVEERWRRFSEEFRRAPLPETHRAIDERFDDAFAPIYAGIPALLDWHYSFRGRFTVPILAVSGRLDERVESRLLGGLEERIGLALDSVAHVMHEEGLNEFEHWYDREVASVPLGLRTVYKQRLTKRFVASMGPTALKATIRASFLPTALEAATVAGPPVLANRVAGRLSPGFGSTVLRAGRSLMGRLLGRVVAGVVGGVAGWLALDFTLGRVEEWRGREELQQGLTALVDEEKAKLKSALTAALDDVKNYVVGE